MKWLLIALLSCYLLWITSHPVWFITALMAVYRLKASVNKKV